LSTTRNFALHQATAACSINRLEKYDDCPGAPEAAEIRHGPTSRTDDQEAEKVMIRFDSADQIDICLTK
jgi:hypothetical protein